MTKICKYPKKDKYKHTLQVVHLVHFLKLCDRFVWETECGLSGYSLIIFKLSNQIWQYCVNNLLDVNNFKHHWSHTKCCCCCFLPFLELDSLWSHWIVVLLFLKIYVRILSKLFCLCSLERTWQWVNNNRFFMFGWRFCLFFTFLKESFAFLPVPPAERIKPIKKKGVCKRINGQRPFCKCCKLTQTWSGVKRQTAEDACFLTGYRKESMHKAKQLKKLPEPLNCTTRPRYMISYHFVS